MSTPITDIESRIKERIAERIGPQRFRIWFRNSTHLTFTDGHLKIGVPNLFIGGWIENHFAVDIAAAAREVLGEEIKVIYTIDPVLFRRLRKTQLDSQAEFIKKSTEQRLRPRDEAGGSARPAAPLRGKLDEFVVGPRNAMAYTAAQSVVAEPGGTYNPVFYHGPCGLGKTHLLHGIANGLASRPIPVRWRYVSGEGFTNEFLMALKLNTLDAFRHRYRDLDVLLIDDVHFLSNKRATQEEFLHTFNAINAVGKQIVLASDAHPRMIGHLSEQLVTRFVAGIVIRVEPPDFPTRCEILRRRARSMNRPIAPDVIEYVAGKIQTNVRELEGALLKLSAYASLSNGVVSLADARQALDDHLARTVRLLTVGELEAATATRFGLTPADLHSSRKNRTIALARGVAMYLARTHTSLSLPEIARMMGNKNHTTVLLAHRRIAAALAAGEDARWLSSAGMQRSKLAELIREIEEQIGCAPTAAVAASA